MRKLLLVLGSLVMACISYGQITIGDNSYASLEEALGAAQNKDVVNISGSITVNSVITTTSFTNFDTLYIYGVNGTDTDSIKFADGAKINAEDESFKHLFFKDLVFKGGTGITSNGGILATKLVDLDIENCHFVDGYTDGSQGGALYIETQVKVNIRDSHFQNNSTGGQGGAILGHGIINIYNTSFVGNSARSGSTRGGAIENNNGEAVIYIEGCLFDGNETLGSQGGAALSQGGNGGPYTVVNSTFVNNTAATDAGVARLFSQGSTFINCTMVGNSDGGKGAVVIQDEATDEVNLQNCIIYNNTPNDVFTVGGSASSLSEVNNSLIGTIVNFASTPVSASLVGDDITNTGLGEGIDENGVITLTAESQARDLGAASYLQNLNISIDQIGQPRNFAGGTVDAGAFEYQVITSDQILNARTGTSYGNDLSRALNEAEEQDTLIVSGSIAITEPVLSETLGALNGADSIYIIGETGADSLIFSNAAKINGSNAEELKHFFFEKLVFVGSEGVESNGGIMVFTSHKVDFRACHFTKGNTTASGGAVLLDGGAEMRAWNTVFVENNSGAHGGALQISGADLWCYNCDFISNTITDANSDSRGGAIHNPSGGNAYLESCLFDGNSVGTASGQGGGGISAPGSGGAYTVINSTFVNNTASSGGAGRLKSANNVFINVTVVSNAAGTNGGGFDFDNPDANTIQNSIIYNNTPDDISSIESTDVIASMVGVLTGTPASISQSVTGESITSPGLATELTDRSIAIDETSQAVNLGLSEFLIAREIATDIRGEERNYQFDRVDAGSYELQGFEGNVGTAHGETSAYISITGLSMSEYQGGFYSPADGSGVEDWGNWGLSDDAIFDFWPDLREIDNRFETSFTYEDGNPAAVYSAYNAQTVELHFRWMAEYGIDGVFHRREVSALSEAQVAANDQVVTNALNAAATYDRALAIMYDLSGVDASTEELAAAALESIKADWSKLVLDFSLTGLGDEQPYLYEGGKPVVAISGVGFDNGALYDLSFVNDLLDFFMTDSEVGECAIMLEVPSNWREGGNDAVSGDEHTALLTIIENKADIIVPLHTGQFSRGDFAGAASSTYAQLIDADQELAGTYGVKYVPNIFPGYSSENAQLAAGETTSGFKPRAGGLFLWDMGTAAVSADAEALYLGSFDNVNNGTQLYKVDNNPPTGDNTDFQSYTSEQAYGDQGTELFIYEDPEDHYLWLAGEINRGLKDDIVLTEGNLPTRAPESNLRDKIVVNTILDNDGAFEIWLNPDNSSSKIHFAPPYIVPDGAPSLDADLDTLLFSNELAFEDTFFYDLGNRNQFIRFVELDDEDKITSYLALSVDEIAGKQAAIEDFSDENIAFEIDQFDVGQTTLNASLPEGNVIWGTATQATDDADTYFVGEALTANDSAIFTVSYEALVAGVDAREGDFILLVELDADGLIVGFGVFEIASNQIARTIEKSDEVTSLVSVELSGSEAIFSIELEEGFTLYRSELVLNQDVERPIYTAQYSNYADKFPFSGRSETVEFLDGQSVGFIEVDQEDRIVGYQELFLTAIEDISVGEIVAPDYANAGSTLISIESGLPDGHAVYLNPTPSEDVPRRGASYDEVEVEFSVQLSTSPYSYEGEEGDILGMVEADANGIIIAYRAVTLTVDNFSVAANPIDNPVASAISTSKLTEGMVDIEVTVADGVTLLRTDALGSFTTVPTVDASSSLYSSEFSAVATGTESVAANDEDEIYFLEFTDDALTGFYYTIVNGKDYNIYYVSEFGSEEGDGSISNPWTSVQRALDSVEVGGEDLSATDIVYITGTIQMEGVESGDGYNLTDKSVRIYGLDGKATLLAAENNRHFNVNSGDTPSKFHFANLIFQGAKGNRVEGASSYVGGAIRFSNAEDSVWMDAVEFIENESTDPSLLESITNNSVEGAALYVSNSYVEVNDGIFERNIGRFRGVIHLAGEDCHLVLRNCYISDNDTERPYESSGQGEGTIFLADSRLDLINTAIVGNRAQTTAGIRCNNGPSEIYMVNSIIANNINRNNNGNAAGLRVGSESYVEVLNSLIFNNGFNDGIIGNLAYVNGGFVDVIESSFIGEQDVETNTPDYSLSKVDEIGGESVSVLINRGDADVTADLKLSFVPRTTSTGGKTLYFDEGSWMSGIGVFSVLEDLGALLDGAGVARTEGNVDVGLTQYDASIIDAAPEVQLAISDYIVPKNADDITVSMGVTFIDIDGDEFSYEVTGNSTPDLIGTSFDGSNLILAITADQEGDAFIDVTATANGKSITESFKVTVGLAPEVVNPLEDFSVLDVDGGEFSIDMSETFDDADDSPESIVLTVLSNSNESLVTSASFDGKDFNFTTAANAQGKATIAILAKSGIRTALANQNILVGAAPVVKEPLSAVNVTPNANPLTRDLSDLFTDEDSDDDAIEKSVRSNSDPSIVAASVNGDDLVLTFDASGKTGTAIIRIEGKSEGLSGFFDLYVNVYESNTGLIVSTPIGILELGEDIDEFAMDVSELFYYTPNASSDGITVTYVSSSDESVATGSISGSDLTIAVNQVGSTNITLNGAIDGNSLDYTFQVIVGDVVVINVVNPISDVEMDIDDEALSIPLTGVFEVVGEDDPDFEYTVTSSDNLLISVSIDNSSNSIIVEPRGTSTGSATVTVTATFDNTSKETSFVVDVVEPVVNSLEVEDKFKLYPVPFKGQQLTIQLGDLAKAVDYIFYDVQGMVLVSNTNVPVVNGEVKVSLAERLSQGMYFVSVIAEGKVYTSKLIVD